MQSKLKDRLQSQMKGRQKIRKTLTANLGLNQESADNSMAQVALLAVMQKNAAETKMQFDKESILAVAGDKEGIHEIIHQYESDDSWKYEMEESHSMDEGKTAGVSSKEEIIALKMAQQRLENEIRHEEDIKERLKLSSIKQVKCNEYLLLIMA